MMNEKVQPGALFGKLAKPLRALFPDGRTGLRRKLVVGSGVLFGVFLLGALVAGISGATGGQGSGQQFLTAHVSRGDLISVVTATGAVKALLDIKVGSQLSGQVAELLVDFNDPVTKGQPLAKLDARTYEAKVREARAAMRVTKAKVQLHDAAITQANADLESAKAKMSVVEERMGGAEARYAEAKRDFGRKKALRKKRAVSQASIDKAEAEFHATAALFRAEKAQLRVEKAAISSARASLRRAQAEYQDAVATVERQEALLSQAEIELSRTVIRAPIDGIVVGRDVEQGQTVAASLEAPTLFQIANDLFHMEVHVRVDEADIGRVRIGQKIRFSVDAYPGREFSGAVVQVRKSPTVIDNVVTYTVVVSAPNPDLLLLPGMTATVRIVVLERHDVLKVPNAALRFRMPKSLGASTKTRTRSADRKQGAPGKPGTVWMTDGSGSPEAKAVRIGASDGVATELLSDTLKSGDPVVVGVIRPPKTTSFFGLRFGF